MQLAAFDWGSRGELGTFSEASVSKSCTGGRIQHEDHCAIPFEKGYSLKMMQLVSSEFEATSTG